MKNSKIKIKKGFTLVELLAIMVIIAVITAIGVPVYQSSSMKTKEKTFNIKIDNAHQSGKLWALDHLDCFKTDACSELITPVECVQGGSNDNDDCYVMSLNTLASEGYYDYDDKEGNILNPIDNSSMNDEQILLVYNNKYGKVSDVPLNTYIYKILTLEPSAQRTQNHTVNISNLYDIASITSDNGTVTYEKNKNNINITIKNGDSVGTEWNPKLHSKSVTANRTSSNNSFDNTYSYDDGEYSGTINKDGVSAVISGEYIPEHRKNVTGQTSANYNQDGYTGTLSQYVHSGSYTPADTIYVTNQGSSNYNSGGYTGTLSQYLHSGSYTPSDTKYVTAQTSANYNSGGYVGTLTKYVYSGSYTAAHTKYVTAQTSANYNSGGYVGTLTKYVYSGSYTAADTKYVTAQTSANYNSGGYVGTLTKYVYSGSYTPADTITGYVRQYLATEKRQYKASLGSWTYVSTSGPTIPSSVYYSSGGYSGTLYKSGSKKLDMTGRPCSTQYPSPRNGQICYYNVDWSYYMKGNITKPASDTRVYRYRGNVTKPASDTRVYRYEGNVTKPASDTRVYRYQGNVTKPASDTRVYRYQGNVTKPASDTRVYRYQGEVIKPASDTRVWQQDYLGTAYKGGDQDLYSYKITIVYNLK